MFLLAVYVPETHSEIVKESLFKAGAGRIGDYSHCSFETKGLGQFKPLPGTNPHVGLLNELEKVEEVKVEMVVEGKIIKQVIEALKKSHPYETPAYHVLKCEDF
ncbi:MAG: NGG1p interacting factor NIF3 [Bacteriovoracaceae bacterium]